MEGRKRTTEASGKSYHIVQRQIPTLLVSHGVQGQSPISVNLTVSLFKGGCREAEPPCRGFGGTQSGGLCVGPPEKLLFLLLRAAAGGTQQEEKRGAAPHPRSGTAPLTAPLELTPMGQSPCRSAMASEPGGLTGRAQSFFLSLCAACPASAHNEN